MKKITKTIAQLAFACLMTICMGTRLFAFESIPIRINNVSTELDARLINSTTYVKLSEITAILNRASDSQLTLEAEVGKSYISVRGRYLGAAKNLELEGELFIPIRSAAKAYGAAVEWLEESRSVELYASEGNDILPGDEFYDTSELYWLSRIINAEAGGEPIEGKILVGNVIQNRVKSDEFPDTIYEVIFDCRYGVQFTPTINGMLQVSPNEESVIAAKLCLDSYSLSSDALYFLNPELAANFWVPKNRPFLFRVGGHEFYS